MNELKARILIIGVGNPSRRDDAVGLVVARALRARNLKHIEIIELSGEGAALLEAWQGAERVVIVDAMQSGAAPGTILRFEAHRQRIPTKFFRYSTHNFGLAEAIELGRALGQLPQELIVYGIEGKDFSLGEGLSPEVASAISQVLEKILAEL
uniref:Hydrogenase 2 maturation protease n=2 Tax=Candidatus Bipolaricaulota TaxID=67810 RepID=H5SHA5_9BACT|nr:hydrogenase 2 maturation protease [uncultured Acetothermia bacterium]BAL58964.1 hydrogenase 2 maturation protease [Candidatus Acetothermum autotrophicum]